MSALVQARRKPPALSAVRNLAIVLGIWLAMQWLLRSDPSFVPGVNLATWLLILIGCLVAAVRFVAPDPVRLWYPLPWFLITAAVYYGFGPLVYVWGTAETMSYADAYYPVDQTSLGRVNALTLTGLVVVLSTYYLMQRGTTVPAGPGIPERLRQAELAKPHLRKLALVFVAVGVPVKFAFVLPSLLGNPDATLSGVMATLSVFSTVALVPLYLLAARDRVRFGLPFGGLLLLESASAFMTLSKLEVLKVGLVLVLASTLAGVRFRRIATYGVIGTLVFAIVLTPLVSYARLAYNVAGLQSVNELGAMAASYARSGGEASEFLLPGVQGSWARLDYAPPQAFAMDEYDAGRPGTTFGLAPFVLVPRFLYPDKPIMNTGREFNILVTGSALSQSSPGMFAEAYWNGGWWMLVGTCVFLALLYSALERYGVAMLERGYLAFLPVLWIGLFAAIQQDSWFIPGTIGALPLFVALHVFGRFVEREAPPGELDRPAQYA